MRKLATALQALVLAGVSAQVAWGAELGDDGLHKADWMRETFKDLREDLAEAGEEGKRLMLLVEQRGCIYCAKMHEEVFPMPEIEALIEETYFVVQLNMFGDVEVIDFDGEALPEKDMVRKWNVLFTPTAMFFPETVPEDVTADRAAVAVMPGAFSASTTMHLLEWVRDAGYENGETFQKYHARRLEQ
ncbi:thioredoxin family protein [Sulfitobacter sp. D35]|uniref:thioredoxin family protein n=1 Tax=Sulfitobacter sp. D35 TaxID=3083252 RepID=UPI00296F552B|nr:thioredoxin family protein [Sulfitobacter sp. D35]MDW4498754.1 thioredoxin family protein [Sulfitobacter sp. D35]